MFGFLERLPEATEFHHGYEKSEGVKIGYAIVDNALVNVLFGEKSPRPRYEIGVGGRGSLFMEEQEFRNLLSSMIKVFETRSPGYVPPPESSAE